jgi:glutamine amidotransferase
VIGIVDTGGANHSSVLFALQRLGLESTVSLDPKELSRCSHLVLPGVGHAAHAMNRLHKCNLVPFLKNTPQPILGICLGLQLLFDVSSEGPIECLGLIPGKVTQLEATPEFRVPHMGWSRVRFLQAGSPLFAGIAEGSYFYFVHSYRAPHCEWTTATTNELEIPAALHWRNVTAVQFHPERSGEVGARLLKNYFELNRGAL